MGKSAPKAKSFGGGGMGKRAPQIQSLVFWHMDPYPITIGNPLSIALTFFSFIWTPETMDEHFCWMKFIS